MTEVVTPQAARGGVVVTAHPDELADINAIGEECWRIAQSRFAIIKPLIEMEGRTREHVDRVAEAAGVGAASVYRWLQRYETTGRVSSLAPGGSGLRQGQTRLDERRERIITKVIEELYLVEKGKDPQTVYDVIATRCRNEGLEPPSRATFGRRLRNLPKAEVLRRRGKSDRAFELYGPTHRERDPGEVPPPPSAPLEEVQMDHTRADVILVEEATREPIGRPWVTMMIDVFSRMPVSLFVSMTPPCAASNGLCVARGMLPKEEWLESMGVEGDWPVHGRIGRLRLDNGKDFRSGDFIRAAVESGIDVVFRPVKKPADGAYIERLMGVLAKECAKLPGRTMANVRDRRGLDPEADAGMTLREFEAYLLDFFVNKYAVRPHKSLNCAPLLKFREGVLSLGDAAATGPGAPVADPAHLYVSFMPSKKRTVQRYGLHMFGLRYWSDTLASLVKTTPAETVKTLKKYTVRYDPFDLSYVLLYDDAANLLHRVPLARGEVAAFSVWDMKAVRRVQKREGQKVTSEPAFFDTLARLWGRIDTARKRADRRAAARDLEKRRVSERVQKERRSRVRAAAAASAPSSALRFARPTLAAAPALPPLPEAFDDFGDD